MQSAMTKDKLSALVLLAASTSFGVLAINTWAVVDHPEATSAQTRLLLAFALAGSLIALLMLLSPDKGSSTSGAPLLSFLQRLIGLGTLMVGYALLLETLGFLIATSLFLALGYLLLGERRWWLVLTTSVLIAAVLEILLFGIFGIALEDPLLSVLGLSA